MQPPANQPPFFVFPFQQFQGPGPSERARPELEVSARVRVALQVLSFLSDKTATRLAANDVGFQELDGQKLEPEEKELMFTACKQLTAYLEGKQDPSALEKVAHERHRQEARRPPMIDGLRIACPNCQGQPPQVMQCTLCGGRGGVIVFRDNG
jgi:hypothetical protein